MNVHQKKQLYTLLGALREEVITDEQFAELDRLICSDEEAAREYILYVKIWTDLQFFQSGSLEYRTKRSGTNICETEVFSDLESWQALAEYERHAAAMEIASPPPVEVSPPVPQAQQQRPARKIDKFSLAAAVFCAAAVLLMIVYPRFAPSVPSEMATICDSLDAQWSADLPISPGLRLVSDAQMIQLTKGILKIQTDEQVEIVLEAPTEFCFSSSSEMSINYGRLFARVLPQGAGFTVVTPNSKIVDLGTEFGVLSQIDGSIEVHMFQGKANLFAGGKNQTKTSQILTAGSAVSVNRHDRSVRTISLDERAVVREIIGSETKLVWRGQKYLRLTDLLLNGNGLGTATLEKIEYDPASGTVVSQGTAGYRKGPGKRMSIQQSAYLDSIFVPRSATGNVIVSSAGHRFEECPETSGLYFSNIICQKNFTFFEPVQKSFEQSRRQFEDCGFLYLHSNVGLTIDLRAVRQAVPGLRITSFSAYAGMVSAWNQEPEHSEADVWVLVDGRTVSFRKALRADQGYDIHIDLADGDRFLTLIVTDGGTIYSEGFPANHFDTCGFAEPVFEMARP